MRYLILIAVLFSFAVPDKAAEAAPSFQSNRGCGDWLEARKEDGWSARQFEWGLVGLLDGMSWISYKDFWTAVPVIKPNQVFYWMDNY